MIAVRSLLHMDVFSSAIVCDGCGLPASAAHIAARVERLELVTRFRPIHIHTLFLALEPMARPEDDFYGPPESREFFDSLLAAVGISADEAKSLTGPDGTGPDAAKLLEFQRRGYYLTYLSECPTTPRHSAHSSTDESAERDCISRLTPTLIKRIRFNYKPKHVALLGANMGPLIDVFEQAGISALLLLDDGRPLTLPEGGDTSSLARFRKAVRLETPRAATSSGV
jgi:hypothetical protein